MAELKNLIVNGSARINGNLYAENIKKNGGTSSQFLKADGSVDNNAYSTTNHTHNRLNLQQLPNGANLNNYTTEGLYYSTSTSDCESFVNAPTDRINGEMRLEVKTCGLVSYVIQTYYARHNTEWQIFERTNGNGNWSNWERMISSTEFEENEYVVAQALARLNNEEHHIYNESGNCTYYLMAANNINGKSFLYDASNVYTDKNGNVVVTSLSQTSDERLKDFGKNINLDFAKIKSIPKKYFTWKDDESQKREIGTSAQALQEIYPELVTYNKELDRYAVDYSKLSIVALAAIDKLNEKIAKLEKTLKDNGITD